MKPKIFSTIKFFIGWPLSIIALIFIGRIILGNFQKIIPFLHHIDFLQLLLGLSLFIIFFFIRSFFWHTILQFKGIKSTFLKTAYLWEISEIKRYIPGNVWAIAGRATAFAKEDISKKTILKLWVLEMEFLIFACGIVSLFSLPFILSTFLPDNFSDFFAVFVVLILSFMFLIMFLFSKFFVQIISHIKLAVLRHVFPTFTFKQNLYLLLIMSIAYTVFGLASWVSVYAVFPLMIQNILVLSSFFVFSFFIGYVSLISPMGLGIREAVMTAGLTKFLIVAEAGFAAIFSRVVLILAEITFFLVIILWERLHNGK